MVPEWQRLLDCAEKYMPILAFRPWPATRPVSQLNFGECWPNPLAVALRIPLRNCRTPPPLTAVRACRAAPSKARNFFSHSALFTAWTGGSQVDPFRSWIAMYWDSLQLGAHVRCSYKAFSLSDANFLRNVLCRLAQRARTQPKLEPTCSPTIPNNRPPDILITTFLDIYISFWRRFAGFALDCAIFFGTFTPQISRVYPCR